MESKNIDRSRIGLRLGKVHRLWKMVVDEVVNSLGLSQPRWTLLVMLRELGDGSNQAQLADALGITMPSLTRTLNQLEAQGLILRRITQEDKRTKVVFFTGEGAEVLSRLDERADVARSALLESLGPDDLIHLDKVLDKVEINAEKMLLNKGRVETSE